MARCAGCCREVRWHVPGRGVVMHVTTSRRHPGGHPTLSLQTPAAHANAPDRVHTGDRPRHVPAALGRTTSRGARKQAPGQIANEKRLTARQSATTRERQHLYLQHMPHCSGRRTTTVGRNGLRHCVSHTLCRSQRTINQYLINIIHSLQHPPSRLCYDGLMHAYGDLAPGKEDTRWTL